MAKPQIATRVDDEFYEDFLEYAEEHDISKAEAMRNLLRDGLEHNNTQQLRKTQEELRDEMSEVRDEIIADGGYQSHPREAGVLEEPSRSLRAAGKKIANKLIEVAFYVYIVSFGWLMYQQYGLAATVGVFTAIGVSVWVATQIEKRIRGLSEKDDATLLDGVRAGLGREDPGEDERDQTPAQESA
jgi:hypothetical protein